MNALLSLLTHVLNHAEANKPTESVQQTACNYHDDYYGDQRCVIVHKS